MIRYNKQVISTPRYYNVQKLRDLIKFSGRRRIQYILFQDVGYFILGILSLVVISQKFIDYLFVYLGHLDPAPRALNLVARQKPELNQTRRKEEVSDFLHGAVRVQSRICEVATFVCPTKGIQTCPSLCFLQQQSKVSSGGFVCTFMVMVTVVFAYVIFEESLLC